MVSSSTSHRDVIQNSLQFFKGEGYDQWSVRMKKNFRSQNLWRVVERVLDDGREAQVLESHKDDAKALYLIQQLVDESIFDRIVRFTTSKEAWEHIQT